MEVRVRFRFNKVTGEVELFDVLDEGIMRLSEAEHNRQHDRLAGEVGNVIEQGPQVTEVFPGEGVSVSTIQADVDDTTTRPISDKEKLKQAE